MFISNLPENLTKIESATVEHGFNMPSDRETGSLLATLCSSKLAGRFLELGTGTGLSACWIVSAMDESSSLLTIDNDPSVVAIAKQYISDSRIRFQVEDGLEAIEKLPPNSFDLIFADAMPGKYESFQTTIDLLLPGGICILDDMLPQSNWPEGHQSRVDLLIDEILRNPMLRSTFLNWSTGILLCTKI